MLLLLSLCVGVVVVVVVTPAAIAGGQVVRDRRWRQCGRRHPKPANLLIFNNTLCQYKAGIHTCIHMYVHVQSIKETRVRTLAHMHTHIRVYSVYMYIYKCIAWMCWEQGLLEVI